MRLRIMTAMAVAIPAALAGCGGETSAPRAKSANSQKSSTQVSSETMTAKATPSEAAGDEVATERAKLSKEDRAIVDAQEWCVVNTEGRLGSMGAPVKLTIKGQPVFLCCAGCKR